MMSKIILTSIIIGLTLICQGQTYYMKLEIGPNTTVQPHGNSQNTAYPGDQGWSEIENFSHITSNEANGDLQIQGIPKCGVIEIIKLYYPDISNHLSTSLHTGTYYNKVIIVGVVPSPTGGSPIPFITYTFANVFVGNFNKKVDNSGSAFVLIDYIYLRAGAMHIKHLTILPNGTTTPTETGWNFHDNEPWDGEDPPNF